MHVFIKKNDIKSILYDMAAVSRTELMPWWQGAAITQHTDTHKYNFNSCHAGLISWNIKIYLYFLSLPKTEVVEMVEIPLVEDKGPFILQDLYHGCWYHADPRSQDTAAMVLT